MIIRVWGSRGSLPSPGPHTNRYGGNTTCVEVELSDGTVVIFDAGSGIRNLGKRIVAKDDRQDVFLILTHAHWDHINGFPFFLPSYNKDYRIHVRGGPRAKGTLARFLKRQMEGPYFPVPFDALQAHFDFTYDPPRESDLGSAVIQPVSLSHPNGAYGFRISENDQSFVFIPDNELDYHHEGGLSLAEYVEFCQGATLLFHDAQYTDEEYDSKVTWGHSKVSSVIKLGVEAGVGRLGLFHHDPDHSDEDLDAIAADAQKRIDDQGASVDCFGVAEGMEFTL